MFSKISMGSNQCSLIYGGDQTYVGGHSDTNGRRMISFIGVEECCGYLTQWGLILDESSASAPTITDGRGLFGYTQDVHEVRMYGGDYTSNYHMCGSRALNTSDTISVTVNSFTGRGVCDVTIV